MPELPEVETIRRGLDKYIVGHKIEAVEVRAAKIFKGEKKALVGGKVLGVRRFAKVLSIDISNGTSILIHVKLTGQFIYRGPNLINPPIISAKVGPLPGKHTHVIFKLDRGAALYYNDLRKFGWIKTIRTSEVASSEFIRKLGPEPFNGLTLKKFIEIVSKYKTPIKPLLMNQEKIAGIGNIYANDACYLAKINPKRPANSLKKEEKEKLYKAILTVLKKGIEAGGASELAYVTPSGGEGKYQNYFLAYGQEGKPCERCHKAKFVKYFLGGRGTYVCPNCQR